MSSDKRDDLLELESRRQIFEYVSRNPGVHMREIMRQLDIPTGMADYHLSYMVKHELLAETSEGGHRRFYPRNRFDQGSKAILGVLRNEMSRGVVLYLLREGRPRNHKAILANFAVSGATLSYHLKRMESGGVVSSRKIGREVEYTLVDPEKIKELLVAYRQSFMDALVDMFVETFAPPTEQKKSE